MNRHHTRAWLMSCSSAFILGIMAGCSNSSDDKPVVASKGDMAAGRQATIKYACQSCHGADLAGATSAFPGAANLTPDKNTGLGDWDAATIKTAILTGKDDEGKALCATMPVFGKLATPMTDTEANDIVAYLQSLAAVSKEVPETPCAAGNSP